MKSIINQSIFRHAEVTSGGINNLCTIIHKLAEEGQYNGEVYQGKQFLGSFLLKYSKEVTVSQINIDASSFGIILKSGRQTITRAQQTLEVGGDGYIVLFATGTETDLYLKLSTTATPPKEVFDSRKLDTGDIMAFRLVAPGSYVITNEIDKKQLNLTVKNSETGKFHDPTKLDPVSISLDGTGFNPAKVEKWPLQALIVNIKAPATLTLQGVTVPGMRLAKEFPH